MVEATGCHFRCPKWVPFGTAYGWFCVIFVAPGCSLGRVRYHGFWGRTGGKENDGKTVRFPIVFLENGGKTGTKKNDGKTVISFFFPTLL